MKRTSLLIAIVPVIAVGLVRQRPDSESVAPANAQSPALPQRESEKRILSTINEIVRAGELYANVPVADGRMLYLLAEAANAKNIVEIGTSTGISGLWFCMALQKTGGRLTYFRARPAPRRPRT